MSAIYLTEDDVRRLLTMDSALELVERAFRDLATGVCTNAPRRRVRTSEVMLHLMSAACNSCNAVGLKAYTTGRLGARFHVLLYDGTTGSLDAMIEADWLGQVRTGAASGIATKHMARQDVTSVGVFGSGKQARTQLQAVCAVRSVQRAVVWSRSMEHRGRFAQEMTEICGVAVRPADHPSEAARGMDVIITATNAREPVLRNDWVDPGAHINAVGSNALNRAEIDAATLSRCALIAADSLDQARIEAGDFVAALEQHILSWDQIVELKDVVAGVVPGRTSSTDITLFQSLGLAIEDVVVAAHLVQLARQQALGSPLPSEGTTRQVTP